jgi:uncharacterized protein (TIGR02246 family)
MQILSVRSIFKIVTTYPVARLSGAPTEGHDMTSSLTQKAASHQDSAGPAAPHRGRRLKRALGIAALATVAAAVGGYVWLDATSQVRNTGEAECADLTASGDARHSDHEAVCGVLASLVDAWNANDAKAYGSLFTEDATYTTFVGSHYQGRKDIAAGHEALFAGFLKDTKLADTFLDIRFVSADTAVVTGRGDTYTGDEPAPGKLSKVQTYTLVREADGEWRVAAFHNTKRQPVMERISFLLAPDTRPAAER